MPITHPAEFPEEVFEVLTLREAGELRHVPQPGVNEQRGSTIAEQTEEVSRRLLGKANGEKAQCSSSVSMKVTSASEPCLQRSSPDE